MSLTFSENSSFTQTYLANCNLSIIWKIITKVLAWFFIYMYTSSYVIFSGVLQNIKFIIDYVLVLVFANYYCLGVWSTSNLLPVYVGLLPNQSFRAYGRLCILYKGIYIFFFYSFIFLFIFEIVSGRNQGIRTYCCFVHCYWR